jgi:hypothetical protein
MPPRHVYWTIILDGQPTAFRASSVDELLPTFNRLKQKQPGAVLKWFERGRLWNSRDEARQLLRQGYQVWSGGRLAPPRRPRAPQGGPRPAEGDKRDPSWRPGGAHRDPREKYRMAKKDKWKRFKQKVRRGAPEGEKSPDDRVRSGAGSVDGQPRAPRKRPPHRSFRDERSGPPRGPRRGGGGRNPPKSRGGR